MATTDTLLHSSSSKTNGMDGARRDASQRRHSASHAAQSSTASTTHSSEGLTSFGFLNETDESQESAFGLSSILSRMRNAFGGSEHDAAIPEGKLRPSASSDSGPLGHSTDLASPRLDNGQPPSASSLSKAGQLSLPFPNRRHSGAQDQESAQKGVKSGPSVLSKISNDRVQAGTSLRTLQKPALLDNGRITKPPRLARADSAKSRAPFLVASSSFAPAITSTAAAHAVAPRRLQSITAESLREEEEDSEDVLSTLMRKSGVDQSRRGGNHWSSVPGFPLDQDTLADDARSVYSTTSSRLPRSESFSTSEAHLVSAQRGENSRGGLETSAEAFRRMRGEGAILSKQYWMPDESVKECRECQGFFTPLRRKHHCRICGLVYCSRCASHILPGSRFGLDRADIRVCNYCLRVLSEYERAGRRAIGQPRESSSPTFGSSPQRVATSFARKRKDSGGAGWRPTKGMISGPLEAQSQTPQSQFAANQLFSLRSGADGSAVSIAQGVPRMDSLQDMLHELEQEEPNIRKALLSRRTAGETAKEESPAKQVPFRVKMSDDDKIPALDDDLAKSPSLAESPKKQPKSVLQSRPDDSVATTPDEVAPRAKAKENRTKNLNTLSALDARERTVGDAALRALRKSKLRAREQAACEKNQSIRSGIFPSGRRDSLPNALLSQSDSLDESSLRHLSELLDKILSRTDIPQKEEWKLRIETIVKKVISRIHPQPKDGESMDIRQYIKFKRIPGGKISDSDYINGFVLSKQVATKKMARSLPLLNPRVMVVAFPVDFHRAREQFTSLGPVFAQEQEYTRILVARIIQLRPNLLVVKDSVSRMALDMLEEAGIHVIWNLKMSAIQAISRCCQADIISSAERIAVEPRLGRCSQLTVETFQNVEYPQMRKSLMRFSTSGPARSLGCSIILRGASLEVLAVVKQLLSLLVFAAHNLRLEAQLNRDEGVQLVNTDDMAEQKNQQTSSLGPNGGDDDDQDDLWKRILDALEPFKHSTLSSSVGMSIAPPYQLLKMKDAHERLKVLEQDKSHEREDVTVSPKNETLSESKGKATPAAHSTEGENEKGVVALPTLEDVMPRPSDLQVKYSRALVEHQLFLKDWVQSTGKDPTMSLQRISVLWTLISSSTHKPCVGPRLLTTSFYGQGDETLGQYLERTCSESNTLCPARGCGRPRGMHYSSFVHNDTRVQVVLERFVCPIPGQENNLLMWSYCKRCEKATPVTPVSSDTWGLSFAKYLEIHFYDSHKRTSMCGHDFYADFIRFFSLQNLALRFHRDRDIIVRDVVLPPMRLLPRPDIDYSLKLQSAKAIQERMNSYWASVFERMAAIRKEPCLSVQHSSQLSTAISDAHEDEREVQAFLIEVTRSSSQTDVLVLNRVRSRLQSSVVRWDQFFQEFEKLALPSERDVRRLTTHHLSNVFQHEKTDEGKNGMASIGEALGLAPAAEAEEDAASTEHETAVSSSMRSNEAQVVSHSASSPNLAPATESIDSSLVNKAPGENPGEAAQADAGLLKASPSTPDCVAGASRDSSTVVECRTTCDKIEHEGVLSESSGTESSAARPSLRRGKTAEELRSSKGSKARRTVHIPRVNGPGSGLPASPTSTKRTGSTYRRVPPSSFRPPRATAASASSGIETESDSNAGVGNPARRKLSMGKRIGRLQALDAAKSPREPSSPRDGRPPSRVPIPSTRVSSIARKFDNLQREVEKERERQKLIRSRRARPLLASKPTIQVYRSLREAVRDEESDSSDQESEDPEAEDEADTDIERRPNLTPRSASLQMLQASNASSDKKQSPSTCEETADKSLLEQAPEATKAPAEGGEDKVERSKETSSEEPSTSAKAKFDVQNEKPAESASQELSMTSFLSGTLPASWRASLLSDGDAADGRGSLLKALSSLWARGTLHLPPLELPMRSTEHLFTDAPLVILREDEPSSLIAFTLSSNAYAERLDALRNASNTQRPPGDPKEAQQKIREQHAGPARDEATPDTAEIDSTLRKSEGTHLNFQFTSGDSRFSIRVLFTEQFDAMRRACDRGHIFVQSLSRCSNWADCSGGKSGAAMMKTLDDRFVIKQLSRAEMDAFASNAGAYFRFLAGVLFHDRPTTLAKIYGVYRLTIKNVQTGKTIKLDCAIAENVFANAKMAQTYDLKGALRNRFVQPNGQRNQVLLDGNLITAKSPIYLREGSKRLLRKALFHDSLFLANCDVMDYSLVVGVCEGTAELRVGIIDFIRTFTFGKKAESFLKEAVGGGTEAPTIIDPKQYRARFLAFLESVLLLSPDHWLSDEEVQAQQSVNGVLTTTTAALHASTQTPAPGTPTSGAFSNAIPPTSLLPRSSSTMANGNGSGAPINHAHGYSLL